MKVLNDRKDLTYLVLGLGRFGSALCEELLARGANVIAADNDMERVEAFSDRVQYIARLDATNETALARAGARDADVAVVCLGDNSQGAIMACALLLDLGVPHVTACAFDETQERILKRIGVHEVIRPYAAMGRKTADLLLDPWLSRFADLGGDEHIVGMIDAPDSIQGVPLHQLSLPSKCGFSIVAVERGGRMVFPNADTVLSDGDRLMIFGARDNISSFMESVQAPESGA